MGRGLDPQVWKVPSDDPLCARRAREGRHRDLPPPGRQKQRPEAQNDLSAVKPALGCPVCFLVGCCVVSLLGGGGNTSSVVNIFACSSIIFLRQFNLQVFCCCNRGNFDMDLLNILDLVNMKNLMPQTNENELRNSVFSYSPPCCLQ